MEIREKYKMEDERDYGDGKYKRLRESRKGRKLDFHVVRYYDLCLHDKT